MHQPYPLSEGNERFAGWTEAPTRYLFFTGKGGVGKTSLACATAVHLAGKGMRVLLVSTDPASNLEHVFGVSIGVHDPTPIADVPGLHALNVDPEAAAQAYRDRVIGPMRGVLPEMALNSIAEQLSGACTTEVAAFDEFTALLTDPMKTEDFDRVIFDTAPTGHTLRLMTLPTAWSNFLDNNQSGASCLGPLAGLDKQRRQYAEAVEVLSDPARTALLLVSRPQHAALEEAARTSVELTALGLTNQRLIINGLMPETTSHDPLAQAMLTHDKQALAEIPEALRSCPADHVLLQPLNMVGIDALRRLLDPSLMDQYEGLEEADLPEVALPSLGQLIDEIAAEGHGLIMVLGKGGVGKTTIAAAIAVELAARGRNVHLTTTDPAAHIAAAVASDVAHLEISRIDPRVETERYRAHVLETKGANLDPQGRALLEEDLRSPCTEEIAVFQAFSQVIRESGTKFVIVDTAPTGHTLLLLDATGAYHRDAMRHTREGMGVTTPLMHLQDPAQTKVLLVTLPETTPVLEAANLQTDLRRAGIEPWAWVINASLAAAYPSDPLLRTRAHHEYAQIAKTQRELTRRVTVVPCMATELVGSERLLELTRGHTRTATTANAAGRVE